MIDKKEFISFLPSEDDLKQQDLKKIESLDLSSISGAADDNSTNKHLQTKFMETLKFRIDSRIIKHLKHKKSMKYQDLVDHVIHDLSLQIQIQQNEEQIQETKTLIDKRVVDLSSKEYIKRDGNTVNYLPV